MSHHPDYDTPRNSYDDQLDELRPGRNLYTEMSGRNDSSIRSRGVLEDLAQSTACETAYLRTLTGLIAANNQARAQLANVIAPVRPQIEAAFGPMPKVLRDAYPARVSPPSDPRPLTREVVDQIVETASNRQRRYAGGRS